MEPRTATFLFTDVEGSTRLFQRFPERYPEVIRSHHVLLRQAIEGARGEVFETLGDAVCAVFETTKAAVAAAVDIQHLLQREAWGELGRLAVRVGIHVGAIARRDGQYLGSAVTEADRVMSSGHGGQIVLSGPAAEAWMREDSGSAYDLIHLGRHRLKGGLWIDLFQLTASGMPDRFPDPRTLTHLLHGLPATASCFVGRSGDVDAVAQLVAEHRLVSIVGSAGCGKTQLATVIADATLDDFKDGPRFVMADRADDTFVDALATKQSLLILDGCDRKHGAMASLVDGLLHRARHLHILATCREPLGVSGERPYRLSGLTPANARKLFVARVRATRPGYDLAGSDAEAFGAWAAAMESNPGAIEVLATRWLSEPALTFAQLVASVGGEAAPSDAALLIESLSDGERVLLRRLAGLPASFRLDEAEASAAGAGLERASDPLEVFELFAHLEEEGGIVIDVDVAPDGPRYSFTRPLRSWLQSQGPSRQQPPG